MKCACGFESKGGNTIGRGTNEWGMFQASNGNTFAYHPPMTSIAGGRPGVMMVSLFSCPKCGLVYNQINELNNK